MPEPGREQVPREEVEAVLEVRRELGPSYDDALVDSFVQRIEEAVAGRSESGLAERDRRQAMVARQQSHQFVLGLISLLAAIPISIVLAATNNFPSLLVAWLGLVAINVAHALSGRRA